MAKRDTKDSKLDDAMVHRVDKLDTNQSKTFSRRRSDDMNGANARCVTMGVNA
jgi:hypothetical protein